MAIQSLIPATKDYLWGGTRLLERYGKQANTPICAETWELSTHPDGETHLAGGTTLAQWLTPATLGSNVTDFETFPQLIKYIDAKGDLSVQVHPTDDYALKRENSYGKTEMWYIVEADEGAGIYLGFNRDVTPEEYRQAIENNTLTELLNFYPVSPGEWYFIPAGTIHAIGAGCLICEIQQNSNLTYRVYDYGRVDAQGNPRQLHIDKALATTNLNQFTLRRPSLTTDDGDILALSRYFTVKRLTVTEHHTLDVDADSFKFVTCVEGSGTINDTPLSPGTSIFIPAGSGEIIVTGDATLITSEVRKYYIGIDLGGTFIKGGIVDDLGHILLSDKVPTESSKGSEQVVDNIAALCRSLCHQTGLLLSDMVGIGMGVPGTVDSHTGTVLYSNNLGWKDFEIAGGLTARTGLSVKIANDANVAALGETRFGCGREYNNTVMLTLGTGVGGGLVLDGKLYEGNRSAGAELGHAVIKAGGELCTCGRRGCLEAYASATALIRDTKRAMEANKTSAMWQVGGIDKVDGSTAFAYKDTDPTAKEVVDNYIHMLGCGITDYANIFRPEAVILGGGVCNEGDALVAPLQAILDKDLFGGQSGPGVKILTATLGNRAGILGAAALWMG